MRLSLFVSFVFAAAPLLAAQATTPVVKPVHVVCTTSKGDLDILVQPAWAPQGAARFLQLVEQGFYQDVPLFRCVNNFLCQFGVVPLKAGARNYAAIPDDPVKRELLPFKRGYLSFAGSGPNSRSNHAFITLGEKVESLGTQPWEAPFAVITEPSLSKVLPQLTTRYGDMPPWGKGPDPQRIAAPDGAAYLKAGFPQLDYIRSCKRK
ncbi:peptidylprolyl isomerase [Chitinilyticum piscinae]|uniref:Peptidylprolyl isomerase n=1 Tax=Chitinilyticum piscinae TaxID=2866724 RepID=A0A8J7K8J1_9NEIS|nr:peptidylprolyl isomerase [Chitinilyticum piscinae]MBE9609583.1 peptidylprolyl isomerase [Chitinilyticum piscinae]